MPQKETGAFQLNFKRVAARALRFWYLIAGSFLLALTVAYVINRYSTRIYPVKASIIIKESEENAGAKFLYDNALINPYRNFYNELYIMKSYPLLEGVMEDLQFDVSLAREGEIKTTEYYDPNFPVHFEAVPGSKGHYGKSFYFEARDENTYSLQLINETDKKGNKKYAMLSYGDTVGINGYRLLIRRRGDVSDIINKPFVVSFNDPFSLARKYSVKLSAGWAQLGASVVNLEVQGPVPQKEIDFLNKFIQRYQNYDIEKKNTVATMAMKFLDHQLEIIGDSLKIYEDQVESFKNRNVITTLSEETNRLYQKVQSYEDQKFQYRLTENYYNYISELLKSEQFDGIFTPSSVGITDNIISELINQLIDLQTQVNMYRTNSAKGAEKLLDNPRLEEKVQRINFVKNDILKTIENSRKTKQINIKFIDDQIKLAQQQLSRLPSSERELVGIKRNYSLKENLYMFLLQKRTEAGLSKASTTSDIVVVNPPIAGGFISPQENRNYAVAAGLGLSIPLLFIVLIELFNARIQAKDDIEKVTSVPVIGGVGHNDSKAPLIVYRKPRSAMAESFRAVRSNLNYFTSNKDHQVFMVTSSIPGEGKSFTAINLATVFAMAGKRTIIVGADLRKPKLFDELNLENRIGLSQYLSGMCELDEIIQKSEIEHLYLIAGGPMPPNPSELLIKPIMGALLERLKVDFEYVIVDTPPLALVTDAFVLSPFADHILFLVRQDFTPRDALIALEEQYQAGKVAKISILFNDLKKTGFGYGYGHGYSYGYGNAYGYGGRKKQDLSGYYLD